MGARPEQQLVLNFLVAIHGLWVKYPGTYTVKESVEDLVPALAQICIKALAADIRDAKNPSPKQQCKISVEGAIVKTDGNSETLNLRDVVNKIIHGTPTSVVVTNETLQLHFRNNDGNGWTEAWFSGTQLLQLLEKYLIKHSAERREDEIAQFLNQLGVERFLPTSDTT